MTLRRMKIAWPRQEKQNDHPGHRKTPAPSSTADVPCNAQTIHDFKNGCFVRKAFGLGTLRNPNRDSGHHE